MKRDMDLFRDILEPVRDPFGIGRLTVPVEATSNGSTASTSAVPIGDALKYRDEEVAP